jgi:RES domain-containing protein
MEITANILYVYSIYVEIEIPDEVEILELRSTDLPENWGASPPILETQFIGDDFVMENIAAVLKVPSSIVPPEFNYLINPNHNEAKKIQVVSVEPLRFDRRFKEMERK